MTKIVFFGDPDVTSDAEDIYTAVMKEQNVDLYVNNGDNGYDGANPVELLEKFFPKDSEQYKKLVLVLGNHDDGESESDSTEAKCGAFLPEQFKSKPEFDSTDQSWENTRWLTSRQVGDIYFIGMNSQDLDIEFKRNQYNWVTKEIQTAKTLRSQNKITWIIGAVHKPWFTLKSSHSPYTAVREIYSEMFKGVVNQMWHGHNHNDQAWLSMIAINQSGNAAGQQLNFFLEDGKTIDHSKESGWTTNINGHSGHEHNKFKENATANKNVMWANAQTFSYGVVESNPQTKILNTKWKDKNGQVLFEYNISMAGSGGPIVTPPEPTPIEPTPIEPTPPEPPGTVVCPKDWHYDKSLDQCIPDLEPQLEGPKCPDGYKWNSQTKKCVWTGTTPPPEPTPVEPTPPEPTPIEPTPVEPTPPEPPAGNLLYDSNTDGKWNNGQKRTVTEGDGDQGPNGKGLHTAASGDPTLTIEGNGISHLESSKWGRIYIYAKNYNFKLEGFFMFETDHGEADNISIKLRSRHGNNNHPQGGNNEFGGIGFAFHPSGQVEIKAEIVHGGSSFDFGNLQGPKLELNTWHKYTISGFDENGGITATVAIDDKNIGSKKWSNPHSTAIDKAAFNADSYFWIRMNCHDGKRAKCGVKDLKLYTL